MNIVPARLMKYDLFQYLVIIVLWANHIVDPFLNYSDMLNYDLTNVMRRVNVSGV